jgi:hypothetical protein
LALPNHVEFILFVVKTQQLELNGLLLGVSIVECEWFGEGDAFVAQKDLKRE